MEKTEFSQIRHYLGKSQSQLSHLCVSTKAVSSFEEGWRNIPPYIERQLLFLLSLKCSKEESTKPCWEIKKCPPHWKSNCAAWEFDAGHLCWLINGTFCQGECQENWKKKMELCQPCEVFRMMIPSIT